MDRCALCSSALAFTMSEQSRSIPTTPSTSFMQLFRAPRNSERPERSCSSWTPAEDVAPQLLLHAQPELRRRCQQWLSLR